MSDLEQARQLFRNAGLNVPTIPDELASNLRCRDSWLFSTRPVSMSPYELNTYVREAQQQPIPDYALLAHGGHGINSYAVQYYLVYRTLRMFLHLAWGGAYMQSEEASLQVRGCFSLADDIIACIQSVSPPKSADNLTIVASDLYGSYWSDPSRSEPRAADGSHAPGEVLAEALDWLKRESAARN